MNKKRTEKMFYAKTPESAKTFNFNFSLCTKISTVLELKFSCSVLCPLIHTNRTLDSQLRWYPKTYWVASDDKVANQI